MMNPSPAECNFRMERVALDLLLKRMFGHSHYTGSGQLTPVISRIQRGLYVATDEKRLSVLLDNLISSLSQSSSREPVRVTGNSAGNVATLSLTVAAVNSEALQSRLSGALTMAKSLGVDLRCGAVNPGTITVQCVLPLCMPYNRA